MTKVYLSLGSNIGNRQDFLEQALNRLNILPKTQLTKVSSFYETAAWGKIDQDDFLNICCQLETQLKPQELLCYCQKIEEELGRVRHEHWGPRTIDIDILLYGQEVVEDKNLKIPHPYMTDRAFVLVPLEEIAPNLIIKGHAIGFYLRNLSPSEVRKLPI